MKTRNIIIAVVVLFTILSCSKDEQTTPIVEYTTLQSSADGVRKLDISGNVLNKIYKDYTNISETNPAITTKYTTTFTYESGRIKEITEKDWIDHPITIKNIEYSGSKISKITTSCINFGAQDRFFNIDFIGTIVENFTYLGNNEVAVETKKTDFYGAPISTVNSVITVSNNNITKLITNNPSQPLETTKNFTYDTKFNPYSKLANIQELVLIYKDKLSYNNPISKVEVEKGVTTTYTYTFNDTDFYLTKNSFVNGISSGSENVYFYK